MRRQQFQQPTVHEPTDLVLDETVVFLHHEGLRGLAPALHLDAHNGRVLHLRMNPDDVLDVRGVDVVLVALYQVVLSARDVQPAGSVEEADVAWNQKSTSASDRVQGRSQWWGIDQNIDDKISTAGCCCNLGDVQEINFNN